MSDRVAKEKDVTLLDLLDRILNKGVILWGDVTISVADVDLIYLGLKVLLTSVETAETMRNASPHADRLAPPRPPIDLGIGSEIGAKADAGGEPDGTTDTDVSVRDQRLS
jgi:gas vesicle structural protein